MTTNRLLFAALVVAAASGCARERVAYEVRLSSEPVRRSYRAPRLQQQVVRYVHGADQHRCDATCEEYWPDVYRHGQAEHSCDGTCPSYAAPRPQRRTSLSVDHVQSFAPSSSTHVTTRVSSTYEVEPYDAYPTSSRVVVYGHGHARHRCAASCASYYPLPNRHVSVTVYGHGHRSHHCNSGCSSYRAPYRAPVQVVFTHGHHSHRCWSGCSSYRAPVQIVFGHGHYSHRCGSGCSSYRAPVQVVFGHGHPSHHCQSDCGSWVDDRWSRRRGGGVVLSFGHGHVSHVCGGGCSYYRPAIVIAPRHHGRHHGHHVAPHHVAPHHVAPHRFAPHHGSRHRGHSVGVRVGVDFSTRGWNRRR